MATLCKWHRKDYDSDAYSDTLKIRFGLLASILRLADAMDIDYRRSEHYDDQKHIIEKYYEKQIPHHLSVLNIHALRLFHSRLETRIDLFLNQFKFASFQLGRLVDELIDTPISWPVQIIPVRKELPRNILTDKKKTIIFAYCNSHGLISAAMSKRQLEALGFDVEIICDFEKTGSIHVFWENTFTSYDFKNYEIVVILDLLIPHKYFKNIMEIVSSNRHCHWIYASPLDEANIPLKHLVNVGVDILIADERALFVGNNLDEKTFKWMRIAGISNFDDPLIVKGIDKDEYQIARGLRCLLWELINEKKDAKAFQNLISKIENNDQQLFFEKEVKWTSIVEENIPSVKRCGRVLLLGEVKMLGRFIYDIAYRAIEKQGILPYEDNEFVTPYLIYTRKSEQGTQVLFLSHFSNFDKAYPIKYFVPHSKDQLGKSTTIWQSYQNVTNAHTAIELTIKRINEFFA